MFLNSWQNLVSGLRCEGKAADDKGPLINVDILPMPTDLEPADVGVVLPDPKKEEGMRVMFITIITLALYLHHCAIIHFSKHATRLMKICSVNC